MSLPFDFRADDFVIFHGVSDKPRRDGTPVGEYAFVKLDRRAANSEALLNALKTAGCRVIEKQ